MMASYDEGKEEAIKWICANFSKGSTCLDVGACDGKWSDLLGDYLIMDAVEIWGPYIKKFKIHDKYRAVFQCQIQHFQYKHYDLVIFGDVLEHMSAADARRVIEYAWSRCKDMVIAVPYEYKQGAKNNNPYERHLQDDLTPELFEKRFPGFRPIYQSQQYAYYVKA
jgi:hypothetical protein